VAGKDPNIQRQRIQLSPHALPFLTMRRLSLLRTAATLHFAIDCAVTYAGRQVALSTERLLVSDLYQDLERDYVINGRRSLVDLRIRWHRHLKPVFATIPARDLVTAQISIYVARRLEEKASNSTINRELALLKRSYLLGIASGRLKAGERPFFPMLTERNIRTGFLRDDQYAALARATESVGPWLRAMFEVAFTYGWRVSELRSLRVSDDIDMARRSIMLHPGQTKNDGGRLVFMTNRVYELLGPLIAGKAPGDKIFTRVTRGRKCSICSDARLAEIDSALNAGVKQQTVAEQFKSALLLSADTLTAAQRAKRFSR